MAIRMVKNHTKIYEIIFKNKLLSQMQKIQELTKIFDKKQKQLYFFFHYYWDLVLKFIKKFCFCWFFIDIFLPWSSKIFEYKSILKVWLKIHSKIRNLLLVSYLQLFVWMTSGTLWHGHIDTYRITYIILVMIFSTINSCD